MFTQTYATGFTVTVIPTVAVPSPLSTILVIVGPTLFLYSSSKASWTLVALSVLLALLYTTLFE